MKYDNITCMNSQTARTSSNFTGLFCFVGLPCSPGSPIRVGRIRKFVLPEFSDVFLHSPKRSRMFESSYAKKKQPFAFVF